MLAPGLVRVNIVVDFIVLKGRLQMADEVVTQFFSSEIDEHLMLAGSFDHGSRRGGGGGSRHERVLELCLFRLDNRRHFVTRREKTQRMRSNFQSLSQVNPSMLIEKKTSSTKALTKLLDGLNYMQLPYSH